MWPEAPTDLLLPDPPNKSTGGWTRGDHWVQGFPGFLSGFSCSVPFLHFLACQDIYTLTLLFPPLLYCLELSSFFSNSNHFFHVLTQWRWGNCKRSIYLLLSDSNCILPDQPQKSWKKWGHMPNRSPKEGILFIFWNSFRLNFLTQEEKKLVVFQEWICGLASSWLSAVGVTSGCWWP